MGKKAVKSDSEAWATSTWDFTFTTNHGTNWRTCAWAMMSFLITYLNVMPCAEQDSSVTVVQGDVAGDVYAIAVPQERSPMFDEITHGDRSLEASHPSRRICHCRVYKVAHPDLQLLISLHARAQLKHSDALSQ